MALEKEDIELIKAHIGEWLAEQSLGKPPAVYQVELRERMVRVEEELKHQREPMREGFNAMEKRFEAMDKHFERLEQRLDHFMRWSFGSLVAVGSSIIAVLKLWT